MAPAIWSPLLSLQYVLMLSMFLALFTRTSVCAPANGKKDYTGYSLLQITPTTNEQLQYLQQLWTAATTSEFQLDFWEPPGFLHHRVEVLVSPAQKDAFTARLTALKFVIDTTILDLQPLIDKENDGDEPGKQRLFDPSGFRARMQGTRSYDIAKFQRYDVISNYLRDLADEHPDLITVKSIGTTHDNRPILMAHITGKRTSDGRNKPGIWVDAGIHAREWIAPATAVYFIKTLVTRYEFDNEIQSLVDGLDWYIVPVLNPDGYEYSHTNDRMWRKNRSPAMRTSSGLFGGGRLCSGVDLNRNFDWHWASVGSSSYSCDSTYHGKQAFSEPETRAVRDFLTARRFSLKGYISLHSFSQMWLVPYGHKQGAYATDHRKTLPLAELAAKNIQRLHGTPYRVGTGADLLYSAGGGSEDWAKGKLNIEYSFLLELRPRGSGFRNYGFVMPRAEIRPTAEETWEGIKTVALQIRDQYPVTFGKGDRRTTRTIRQRSRGTTRRPMFTLRTTTKKQTASDVCAEKRLAILIDNSRYCRWWKLFNRCNNPNIVNLCRKSCCE